jgi:glycosyltransferase involved in cell wall biosynthesis
MYILHLISSRGLLGAERVLIELSRALKLKYNCDPIVGVIKNTYNPHVEIIDEAKANHINSVIFPCNSQFDLKIIHLIRKFISNNKVEIIHCHGYKSNFYGLLASMNKIPTITTNHNWLKSHWKLKLYCFLDSLWIRFFSKIVAVSDEIKNEMVKYKIPKDKIIVIDNGIDLGRFDKEFSVQNIKMEFSLNGNMKIIGTVGTLGNEKGHDYLLKAAKEILQAGVPVKFLIVGDGPLRKQLEQKVSNLGLTDSVVLTGFRKDIPELLSLIDVFVLPSIKEGLPIVLLEAMASKKPVIASRVGAIPKVVKHNETGILVEPRDFFALKDAIIKLIDNPEKANYLALEGYKKVKTEFSAEKMCREYYRLYKLLTT